MCQYKCFAGLDFIVDLWLKSLTRFKQKRVPIAMLNKAGNGEMLLHSKSLNTCALLL